MPIFDELLLKIAQNQPLTPGELEDLRQNARAIDEVKNAVKSWLQPGTTNPKFDQMRAEGGEFTVAPLSTLYLELYGDTPQTIADDTITPVLFDYVLTNPTSLHWNIDNQTKIYILNPAKFYVVTGMAQWEANANGRRAVTLDAYDQNGVQLWGYTLSSLKPHGIVADTIPFSAGVANTGYESAYVTISVYQNSGGDLDLEYFGLTMFEVV